jgi:hypoxanthine phosphoribosyltransferase
VRNDIGKVLLTADQIARRVGELGRAISADFDAAGADEEIVILPVLTGSIVFVADLIRQIPRRVRISAVTVSSYPRTAQASRGATIVGALPDDLAGKHVLVVDDILDSGGTIRLIRDELRRRSAATVKVCVLLRKSTPAALAAACDYVGFDIPDEFVVGYGLDYDNYYRNLPDVAVLGKDGPQGDRGA